MGKVGGGGAAAEGNFLFLMPVASMLSNAWYKEVLSLRKLFLFEVMIKGNE
jgi:hypothetical protein